MANSVEYELIAVLDRFHVQHDDRLDTLEKFETTWQESPLRGSGRGIVNR